MNKEEFESLIKEYLIDNLDIQVSVNENYHSRPEIEVTILLEEEVICSQCDYLPTPKLSY